MSAPIKVAIVGATGRTGGSIVNALLDSDQAFTITALARPQSINSSANKALADRGIKVVLADLTGPKQDLVRVLQGADVLISCIVAFKLLDQIPLAEAAKEAGVKRFVPCNFSTPAPRGVTYFTDQKDDVLAAVQRLYLPFTIINIGWWAEQVIMSVPSGRTDHAIIGPLNFFPGDGNTPIALTCVPDIGRYTAKIVADPRTLNQKVFAYTEVLTMNQIAALTEELSGEKVIKNHRSEEEIVQGIAEGKAGIEKDPTDVKAVYLLHVSQYLHTWGIRGDNQPKSAEYLGYLDFKTLYPGVEGRPLRSVIQDVLDKKPGSSWDGFVSSME
ncbi:NAD(P)-binding protein [Xylariomycetidae sp. FL2044]|nr:NAD(P)-binding protein [Xylariomycetidae sp. FL2044]